MGWKFWENKQKELLLESLQSRMTELGDQLSKLTRLQYKTSQDVTGKVEQLNEKVNGLLSWQSSYDQAQAAINQLEQREQRTIEALLNWLDDLDYVTAQLQGKDQSAWEQLMLGWAERMIAALAAMGVHEINLLGRSFDPRYAESIQTISAAEWSSRASSDQARPHVAYEVVEVTKRGFLHANGRLLRKAQVITLREGEVRD